MNEINAIAIIAQEFEKNKKQEPRDQGDVTYLKGYKACLVNLIEAFGWVLIEEPDSYRIFTDTEGYGSDWFSPGGEVAV